VQDEGEGIPLDIQKTLLNDGQTDNSKLNFDGTGIGLSICISFAKALKGLIEFESTPDQGTMFAFIMPILPVHLNENEIDTETNHQ